MIYIVRIILGTVSFGIALGLLWVLGSLSCMIYPMINGCGAISDKIVGGIVVPLVIFCAGWLMYHTGFGVTCVIETIMEKNKEKKERESCGGPYR